jgi:hypothetical protein
VTQGEPVLAAVEGAEIPPVAGGVAGYVGEGVASRPEDGF